MYLSISKFILENWQYFGTAFLMIVGLYFAYKSIPKNKKSDDKSHVLTNMNTIPISINNNFSTIEQPVEYIDINEDKKKSSVRILFVDDNYSEFKMVSILKKAGWINTKGIKDITDLDNNTVYESDIIFVDINGVGKTMFADQGLGLATALKNKYPKKKIIIYSAETQGDRFHKALRQVDDCLSKNAEPYQFIDLIENLSGQL